MLNTPHSDLGNQPRVVAIERLRSRERDIQATLKSFKLPQDREEVVVLEFLM